MQQLELRFVTIYKGKKTKGTSFCAVSAAVGGATLYYCSITDRALLLVSKA